MKLGNIFNGNKNAIVLLHLLQVVNQQINSRKKKQNYLRIFNRIYLLSNAMAVASNIQMNKQQASFLRLIIISRSLNANRRLTKEIRCVPRTLTVTKQSVSTNACHILNSLHHKHLTIFPSAIRRIYIRIRIYSWSYSL